MQFLAFQLQAPLASWGDTAVGEYRGSRDYPGESALLGLLGAALGLRRDDEAAQAALRDGCAFAVGVVSGGGLLRDYHTAQVPGRSALKGRPHATRRDELAVPMHALNTILSTRDYRQDADYVIVVQLKQTAATPLDVLSEALRRPRFVLYLGRKCCPPAAPLDPQIIDAGSAREAIGAYLLRRPPAPRLVRMAWGDGIEAPGERAHMSAPRKDRVIRRSSWQFGDRTEHVAVLAEGE